MNFEDTMLKSGDMRKTKYDLICFNENPQSLQYKKPPISSVIPRPFLMSLFFVKKALLVPRFVVTMYY